MNGGKLTSKTSTTFKSASAGPFKGSGIRETALKSVTFKAPATIAQVLLEEALDGLEKYVGPFRTAI